MKRTPLLAGVAYLLLLLAFIAVARTLGISPPLDAHLPSAILSFALLLLPY